MSTQFLGEIRLFGINFAPKGWAFCDGQLLPISQNMGLFAILGTFYGGDGRANFALPDLRGQVAISQGQGAGLTERFLGEMGGVEAVTLIESELAQHTHTVSASSSEGDQTDPAANLFAVQSVNAYSATTTPNTQMAPEMVGVESGAPHLPHNNLMPYLVVNFCIALTGIIQR